VSPSNTPCPTTLGAPRRSRSSPLGMAAAKPPVCSRPRSRFASPGVRIKFFRRAKRRSSRTRVVESTTPRAVHGIRVIALPAHAIGRPIAVADQGPPAPDLEARPLTSQAPRWQPPGPMNLSFSYRRTRAGPGRARSPACPCFALLAARRHMYEDSGSRQPQRRRYLWSRGSTPSDRPARPPGSWLLTLTDFSHRGATGRTKPAPRQASSFVRDS